VDITDVTIYPAESDGKLLAYASVIIDNSLCMRDLKIVDAAVPFVAMPARRLVSHCRDCGRKNALTARFCNWCGITLESYYYCQTCHGSGRDRGEECRECDGIGKIRLYADIVHPINRECRDLFTVRVMDAYRAEMRNGVPHPEEARS